VESLTVRSEAQLTDPLNLATAHCLADVFGVSAQRMTAEGVPTLLETPFLDPSGSRGWIPHGAIATAPVLERGPNSVELDPGFDTRPGEHAAGFVSIIDARDPDHVDRMLNPGGVERQVSYEYLSCARINSSIEFLANEPIPGKPDEYIEHFAAMPTGQTGLTSAGNIRAIGFSRGGRRVLMLSHVSDLLLVVDQTTGHGASLHGLTLEGANPIGIAVTPDGAKGYVAYDNSMFASVLDLGAYATPGALPRPSYVPYEYREVPELEGGTNGIGTTRLVRHVADVPASPPIQAVGRVSLVDEDPMDPVLRRGRILFTSSNTEKYPDLTAITLSSCASCHPDGGNDGSAWSTMEGERRTLSLFGGVRNRGWLHASATHAEIHEFAESISKERLGGNLSPEDVDALATYVADGIPRLQTPVVDEDLAARGAELFAASCTGCHEGELHTSGRPTEGTWTPGHPDGPGLYDVGTATDAAFVALPQFFESLFPPTESMMLSLLRGDRDLGEGDELQLLLDFRQRPDRARGFFKAPALVNVWDNVLFFHDGRYDDLHDVVRHFDDHLSLGLSDDDVEALVEYLKTL
jgi:mono/diheme cytochrome c family protein